MNIPGIRSILPLLCGLLLLALPSSNAKEPKSNNLRTAASPSPSPKSNARIKPSLVVKIKTNPYPPNSKASPKSKPNVEKNVKSSKSNPEARATPNPDIVGIDYRPGGDTKQKYKAKASPTPKAK